MAQYRSTNPRLAAIVGGFSSIQAAALCKAAAEVMNDRQRISTDDAKKIVSDAFTAHAIS